MKKLFLFGMFVCGTTSRLVAQDTTQHRLLRVRPIISIENVEFGKQALAGKVGVELQFKPTSKVNINFNLNGFLSQKTNAESLGASPNASTILAGYQDAYGNFNKIIPTSSTGSYPTPLIQFKGATASLDAGIPFKLKDSSSATIEPFLGIEGKLFNRSTIFGEGSGYTFTEQYKFLSPTLGAKLNYTTKSKVKLTFRVSAAYPVIAKVKTDDKNLTAPNTEVNLTKQLSPSVEVGAKVKKMTIRFRYERVNIGSSDTLQGVSQPAPKVNITGITIGYDF
jgi:hypothetical protein